MLSLKLPSPRYFAVTECGLPVTVKAEVDRVAVFPAREPVPSDVGPSKNSTLPVGVPTPGATTLTCAVKVTDCPKTVGLTEAVTEVVVSALLTT